MILFTIPMVSDIASLAVLTTLFSVGDELFNSILSDAVVDMASESRLSSVVNAPSPAVFSFVLAAGGLSSVSIISGGFAAAAAVCLYVLSNTITRRFSKRNFRTFRIVSHPIEPIRIGLACYGQTQFHRSSVRYLLGQKDWHSY